MKTIVYTLLGLFISLNALAEQKSEISSPHKGMVYVPAGEFIMGSDVGDSDESPKHTASTGKFFIDEYEVSNTAFKKFDPNHTYRKDRENHPALVTWDQANAYAKSIGKRLPTEKEWEKAARGTDGRLFPWGNTYDLTFVQYNRSQGIAQTIAKPKSPYGCYDMAGGAMEWVQDWYNPYPGNDMPSDKYGKKFKVLKGGQAFNDVSHMRCAHRFYLPKDDRNNYLTGFRCAKDVKR